MQTTLKPITNIHRWRRTVVTLGTALAMTLTTAAFAANSAPTALGTISPTAVWEGDTVTLDGSASHTNPCCTALDPYLWQQQAGPTVAASPNNSALAAIATFVAPTVPLADLTVGVQFKLKVTDNLASGGDKNSFSNSVTTTVYASPGANAGPKVVGGVHVNAGTLVMLTGGATRVQP